jgi:hypothetical protein
MRVIWLESIARFFFSILIVEIDGLVIKLFSAWKEG